MKNKKQFNNLTNFLKLSILFFGFTFLFLRCDNENDTILPIEEQFQGELVEKVSFEQIQNDPLFSNAFNEFKLNELNYQAQSRSSNSDDFEIQLNTINKIVKENATTYTFEVKDKNDELPPFAFKNLVLEITSGKTQGYFITYYPTNEYIQNKINNIESDFIANITVSSFRDNISQLLNQINNSNISQRGNCVEYLTIETVCASDKHWPGENCDYKNDPEKSAKSYSFPVFNEEACSSGGSGEPVNLGDNQIISTPGGGGISTVNNGSTFPNIPSGLGNIDSNNVNTLLNYNPSILENKTNYFNYLKNISTYCNVTGNLDLGLILYGYGANSNLTNQELVIVSSKAKKILSILAKNNFVDIEQYSLADQKIIAENTLFIDFLPQVKSLVGNYWPQNDAQWNALQSILFQPNFLTEIGLAFVPGSSIIDVVSGLNSNDYVAVTVGIAGLVVDAFGGTIFRAIGKVGRVAYKSFKIFKIVFRYLDEIVDVITLGYKADLVNGIVKISNTVGTAVAEIQDNIIRFLTNGAKSLIKVADLKLLDNILPSPGGNIGKTIIDEKALRIKPDNSDYADDIADIVQNGDPRGIKTEELMQDLLQQDGFVAPNFDVHIPPSNNGFDNVFVKKDASGNITDIIINESKQVSSAGSISLSSGVVGTAGSSCSGCTQMTTNWIDDVLVRMDLQGGDLATLAGEINDFINISGGTITQLVSGVNKNTGELIIANITGF